VTAAVLLAALLLLVPAALVGDDGAGLDDVLALVPPEPDPRGLVAKDPTGVPPAEPRRAHVIGWVSAVPPRAPPAA
jgi:hypothetical protein